MEGHDRHDQPEIMMLEHDLDQHDHNETTDQIGPFAIFPLWLIQREPSRAAVYVYVALAAIYANRRTGAAWPSVKRLADDTGLSPSAVTRAKNELRELGAILVEERHRDDGSRTSDAVTILQVAQTHLPPSADAGAGLAQTPEQEQEPFNDKASSKEEALAGQQQLLADESRLPAKADAVVYIRAVFDYWREVMHKQGNVLLNDKRKAAIAARLREGYSVEDLKLAVDGCALTPHNMGKNDRGRPFNDIELICRTGTNVERFRDTAAKPSRLKRDRHRLGQTTIDDDAVFARGRRAISGEATP